ncbi:MAG: 1-acyl-sn-glycerol-3-phosphate acyltransferase, partial [Pseudomonadota bacterium]
LKVPIQPFKLASRADTVKRLIYDPEVALAVAAYAREEGVPVDVAAEAAERYAREIVPGFSAFAYFGFAIRAAKLLSQTLFRVRLVRGNDAQLEAISPEATVIFVMNHRSNMDYVLVTWLVAERSALAYAVGEWARVWPLRQLVRALGGYFIRRRYNNALYRKVLARYVQMATEAGITQAVFPEGGLSRTGALGKPKLGLISYILDGFDPGTSRDVVFVPVAINYDRVMEDRNLIAAQQIGGSRFTFSIWPILRYIKRRTLQRLAGKFHRYGYASVSFGMPLSLTAFLATPREDQPAALGETLMARIGSVMPVPPVPFVALAIREGLKTAEEIAQFAERETVKARAAGITVHVPRDDTAYAVSTGLRILTERRIIADNAGRIDVLEGGEPMISFYAASVAHLFETTVPDGEPAPQPESLTT